MIFASSKNGRNEGSSRKFGFRKKIESIWQVDLFKGGITPLTQAGITHSFSFGNMLYKLRNPDSFSASSK